MPGAPSITSANLKGAATFSGLLKPQKVSYVMLSLDKPINLTDAALKRYGNKLLNEVWSKAGSSRVVILNISKAKGVDSSGITFLEEFQGALNNSKKVLVLVAEDSNGLFEAIKNSTAFDHVYKNMTGAENAAKKLSIELAS